MKYAHLSNILQNASHADAYAMEKIAEEATIRAEQNIIARQAMQEQLVKESMLRRANVLTNLRYSLTKIAAVQEALDAIEDGEPVPEELVDVLPELIEEAEMEEDALVEALMEGEDLADEEADDILELAADDPDLAAELIQDIDGIDVDGDDVDALSDVVADAVIAEELGDESAKAANNHAYVTSWLQNATPTASFIVKEAGIRKALRILNQ